MRVGAVSYLNTVPLVFGMQHGDERQLVDLSFSVPSVCAERVEAGSIDIGLVPVAEIARQQLEVVSPVGIAARGAVRSILLFSKQPWPQVRTLAVDSSSRTSVQLARVILQERFGATPTMLSVQPDLEVMLRQADAALIIGDPALRIDPEQKPYAWLDLAAEWFELTHLPFVFALWAGKRGIRVPHVAELTSNSYRSGRARLVEIAAREARVRQLPEDLAYRYLSEHLWYEIGPQEQAGLEAFLSMAGLAKAHV